MWLMNTTIHWVVIQPAKDIHPTAFCFDLSDETTDHNFEALKQHNFKLEYVLVF